MATDSFAGAEASVDQQRKSALDALAQFGRRGLEAAVLAQQESGQVRGEADTANQGFASERGVGSRGQAELSALAGSARDTFAQDRSRAVDFLGAEQGAIRDVAGNYFGQVREAVPLERTAAQQIVDQYRAAYAERQAAIAAQEARDREIMQRAALQEQLMRDQMARDAELQRLILLGLAPAEAEAELATRLPAVSNSGDLARRRYLESKMF